MTRMIIIRKEGQSVLAQVNVFYNERNTGYTVNTTSTCRELFI